MLNCQVELRFGMQGIHSRQACPYVPLLEVLVLHSDIDQLPTRDTPLILAGYICHLTCYRYTKTALTHNMYGRLGLDRLCYLFEP